MEFVNTPTFSSIITFAVGLVALLVYLLQRFNHRRDAAEVILGELRSSKDQLMRIREHVARFKTENQPNVEVGLIPSDIFLMPTESWTKYKHLFTRKLDRHVYDMVSKFYERASSYDQSVTYNNGAFAKNEESIRANLAKMIMQVTIDETVNGESPSVESVAARVEAIRKIYMRQSDLEYAPRKPIQDAQTDLSILGDIDLSLAILRLKRLTWRRH